MSREREGPGFQNSKTTVFIARLPQNLDCYGLKGVFSKIGKVLSAVIPMKLGRNRGFGFIRFEKETEAKRSILEMNNKLVRGKRIVVEAVKGRSGDRKKEDNGFANSELSGRNHNRSQWPDKPPHKQNLRSVEGEENDDLLKKLLCSLVVETPRLSDVDMVSKVALGNIVGLVKVISLQKNIFILQFQSEDLADRALVESQVIHSAFLSCKKWSSFDVCKARNVWLDIRGVPPCGWKEDNFKGIAEFWGIFLRLERSIDSAVTFESMKALVLTNSMSFIQEEVWLNLKGIRFKIYLREVMVDENPIEPQVSVEDKSPQVQRDDIDRNPNLRNEEASQECEVGIGTEGLDNSIVNRRGESAIPDNYSDCGLQHKSSDGREVPSSETGEPEEVSGSEVPPSENGQPEEVSRSEEHPAEGVGTQVENSIEFVDTQGKRKAIGKDECSKRKKAKFQSKENGTVSSENLKRQNKSPSSFSDIPEDNFKFSAIRSLNLGNKLGVKLMKGAKNEEAYIRRTVRNIRKQKRYVSQSTSEETSQESQEF